MKKRFHVITKEGTMEGQVGDWLLEGIEGELYPCDNSIFEKSYITKEQHQEAEARVKELEAKLKEASKK
jgi:hypothetical protein